MKRAAKALASIFGVGFFPVAPGTLASLVIMILYKAFFHKLSLLPYLACAAGLFFIGVAASSLSAPEFGSKDPKKIVIDEVCGQWLALAGAPPRWWLVLSSFLLFRAFDIIKPFPIRNSEKLSRGWGIMADDVLAAVYVVVIYQFYRLLR
jgi:phosphatidylglycerophosphatase A